MYILALVEPGLKRAQQLVMTADERMPPRWRRAQQLVITADERTATPGDGGLEQGLELELAILCRACDHESRLF